MWVAELVVWMFIMVGIFFATGLFESTASAGWQTCTHRELHADSGPVIFIATQSPTEQLWWDSVKGTWVALSKSLVLRSKAFVFSETLRWELLFKAFINNYLLWHLNNIKKYLNKENKKEVKCIKNFMDLCCYTVGHTNLSWQTSFEAY